MADEFDVWATGSGLLTDYDGTVIDAWFQKGDFGLQMQIKMTTDSPDTPETTEFYSCGSDWDTFDGGKTAEHPKGERQPFNRSSSYGKFITAALGVGEATLRERGNPKDASVWLGTKWHMSEVANTFKDRTTGESRVTNKNFPSAFLGVVEDGQGKAPEQSPKAVEADPATNGDLLAGLPDGVAADIRHLATTTPHSEWVDKVMDLTGVLDNDSLVTALADESGLYSQLKG